MIESNIGGTGGSGGFVKQNHITHQNMAHLINYQTFPTLQDAAGLIELLEEHQIAYEVDDSSMRFGLLGNDNTLETGAIIKINADDVERVKGLDLQNAPVEFTANHYLHTFSDKDIMDIFVNPTEWTDEEIELAREIAAQRKLQLSAEAVKYSRQKSYSEVVKKIRAEVTEEFAIMGRASWFVWIGGATFVNLFLIDFATNLYLPIGLRANWHLLNVLVNAGVIGGDFYWLVFVFGALLPILFVWIWRQSRKGNTGVYLAGMILYAVDTLLCIRVQDWLIVGFHLLGLIALCDGYIRLLGSKKRKGLEDEV